MIFVSSCGSKGLDFVISEARKYGIKLVLSMVNNYDQFGGKKQYVNWARGQGQSISSDDDFFTNSVVKQYYKNHIKVITLTPRTHQSCSCRLLFYFSSYDIDLVRDQIFLLNF